jgi:hypothetical protein
MAGLPGPMVVHPKSQLSGTAGPNEAWVVYQNPKLNTMAIVRRHGQWNVAGVIPAAVPPGASHVALADPDSENSLNLFFVTENGEICRTHGNFVTGEWTSELPFPTGCPFCTGEVGRWSDTRMD